MLRACSQIPCSFKYKWTMELHLYLVGHCDVHAHITYVVRLGRIHICESSYIRPLFFHMLFVLQHTSKDRATYLRDPAASLSQSQPKRWWWWKRNYMGCKVNHHRSIGEVPFSYIRMEYILIVESIETVFVVIRIIFCDLQLIYVILMIL